MKNIAYLFSAAALLLGAAGADAKVALPQVLSDGMVVQRGKRHSQKQCEKGQGRDRHRRQRRPLDARTARA